MTECFYFYLDGRRVGPLELPILKTMAQCGQIAPETKLEREDGRRVNANKVLPNDDFGGGLSKNTSKEKTKKKRRASANANDELRLDLLEGEAADCEPLNPFGDVENPFVALWDECDPFDCLPPLKERRSKSLEYAPFDGEIRKSKKRGTKVVSAKPELFYFYNKRKRRWGPVTAGELKQLAVEARIDEQTIIEASDGSQRLATGIRELAVVIRANAKARKERPARVALGAGIVLLCLLGTIGAVGGIIWALTHPMRFGRFLVIGAVGVLALGAAVYIGKAAYGYISEYRDEFSKALKKILTVGAAIVAIVALWKLFGIWLLLAPLCLFGLAVLFAIASN